LLFYIKKSVFQVIFQPCFKNIPSLVMNPCTSFYYSPFGLKSNLHGELTICDQNIIKSRKRMSFLKNVPNSSNYFNVTVFSIFLIPGTPYPCELTFLNVVSKNINFWIRYIQKSIFARFSNVHNQ